MLNLRSEALLLLMQLFFCYSAVSLLNCHLSYIHTEAFKDVNFSETSSLTGSKTDFIAKICGRSFG